ncbi:hypothetical protein ACFYU5_09230 [Nocardia aobensis]|uniref:Uncharacterized protein n=1 Tax=Nocardia aobensis TaxID=257277 RepID=A0ABW6NZG7_9NOCA
MRLRPSASASRRIRFVRPDVVFDAASRRTPARRPPQGILDLQRLEQIEFEIVAELNALPYR